MREVVIVSGARTAIGTFGGGLKTVSAIDLGATVMKETLKRAGVRPVPGRQMVETAPDALRDQGVIPLEKATAEYDAAAPELVIDEVIMGNVLTGGQGQNPARQAMIRAGIPKETPAFTLNKVCGSGLKAITVGAQAIMTGQADVVLAGGLYFLLRKPVSKALRARIEGIEKQLEDLEARKQAAEKELAAYADKIARLDQEAAQIVAEYERQGQEARVRIIEEAKAAAQKLEEQAKRNIAFEMKSARERLQAEVVEKALQKAESRLKERMTAEDQDRLIDEYLAKVVAS